MSTTDVQLLSRLNEPQTMVLSFNIALFCNGPFRLDESERESENFLDVCHFIL